MTISTQVVDCTSGRPGAGMRVHLARRDEGRWISIAIGVTGPDGRVAGWDCDLGSAGRGMYRLTYDTNAYFAELGQATCYPEIAVAFIVSDPRERCDLVLMVTPHSYTTYHSG